VPTDDAPTDVRLDGLNALSESQAVAALMTCCGSTRWAERMAASRPFSSWTQVHGIAEWLWWLLDDADWLEAFTHHPRIGSDPEELREKFAATAVWSGREQAGVSGVSDEVIGRLALRNTAYEEQFGYIFIVCASGLSAEEMLSKLSVRMDHNPENEIRIAAGEQAKITALRIEKLELG
jgi:2-oxo-4-hydroxy-4-carboxy-5-ureidoimidazoline decarboxylase